VAQAGGTVGLGAIRRCLTASDSTACLDLEPAPVGATTLSTTGGESGSASGSAWQPGQLAPGGYQARFQAALTPDGTRGGYSVLVID
jgi:hypothetical protein